MLTHFSLHAFIHIRLLHRMTERICTSSDVVIAVQFSLRSVVVNRPT